AARGRGASKKSVKVSFDRYSERDALPAGELTQNSPGTYAVRFCLRGRGQPPPGPMPPAEPDGEEMPPPPEADPAAAVAASSPDAPRGEGERLFPCKSGRG